MNKKIYSLIIVTLIGISVGACALKGNEEEMLNESVVHESYSDNQKKKTNKMKDDIENNNQIYYIDKESGETLHEEIPDEETNAENVWALLKNKEIVPSNSKVISMSIKEKRIVLDVDSYFGDYLRTQGTTGEYEIIKCIVNSYLSTFQADEIKITEEGNVLMSGHSAYDDYLRAFEN